MRSLFNTFRGILLILMFSSLIASAQIHMRYYDVDAVALYPGLQQATGEKKADILNLLSFHYSFRDADSCRYYADSALQISRGIGYAAGEAEALRNLGHLFNMLGNFYQALEYYHHAYDMYEIHGSKRKQAELLYDIAETNYLAGDFSRTIEYGERAGKMASEANDDGTPVASPWEIAFLKATLGITYREYGDYDRSIAYMKEYLQFVGDSAFPAVEHSMFLNCVGHVYFLQGKYDSSLVYFKKAGFMEGNDPELVAMKTGAIYLLGEVYQKLGNMPEALKYHQQALATYRQFGQLEMVCLELINIGKIYNKGKNFQEAESCFRQAWQVAGQMLESGSIYANDSVADLPFAGFQIYKRYSPTEIRIFVLSSAMQANRALSGFYLARGDSARSYSYFMQYASWKDSLDQVNRMVELQDIQSKYETDRRKQQIDLLSTENEMQQNRLRQNRYLFATLGGMIILILFTAFLLFRQSRIRNRQKEAALEQKLLRSQMNPHFIYNSLASIQNKIINEEADQAADYLARFSLLFRNILEGSMEETISLREEITTITNYLELQSIRFPERFTFLIHTDSRLDPEEIFIPPMLAQPFIENSIEHGFRQLERPGNLAIRFLPDHESLLMEIEDDGIGRRRAQEILWQQDKGHKSLATAITRDRIALINKKRKKKITLDIIDLKDEAGNATGTLVRFRIPAKTLCSGF
ncbi:MAG: tetratricopeptide repeat protein [Bacteroidales bacterium]|nr:tetratricopeptide repeat protein [Bacteroidales bacterium]